MWFIYPLGVAITWGLLYAISEIIIRKTNSTLAPYLVIQPFVVLFSTILYFFNINEINKDFKILFSNMNSIIVVIASGALVLISNLFIVKGIKTSNAAMTSMIEISYPIFVVIFSAIIFKNITIKIEHIIGLILILIGSIIIIVKK